MWAHHTDTRIKCVTLSIACFTPSNWFIGYVVVAAKMVIFGANTIHLYNFMAALKIEHFNKLKISLIPKTKRQQPQYHQHHQQQKHVLCAQFKQCVCTLFWFVANNWSALLHLSSSLSSLFTSMCVWSHIWDAFILNELLAI